MNLQSLKKKINFFFIISNKDIDIKFIIYPIIIIFIKYLDLFYGDWGLGIGDWGLGSGEWGLGFGVWG